MILNYTTYTLFIFTLNILQCVISFLSSVCCNHLIVYCLRVSVSKIGVSATNVKTPVAFSTNIASKHKSNTFRW